MTFKGRNTSTTSPSQKSVGYGIEPFKNKNSIASSNKDFYMNIENLYSESHETDKDENYESVEILQPKIRVRNNNLKSISTIKEVITK